MRKKKYEPESWADPQPGDIDPRDLQKSWGDEPDPDVKAPDLLEFDKGVGFGIWIGQGTTIAALVATLLFLRFGCFNG